MLVVSLWYIRIPDIFRTSYELLKKMIMKISVLLNIAFVGLSLFVSSCNDPDEVTVPTVVKEPITITIDQLYDGQALQFYQEYVSSQGNPISFTTNTFYLSNIVAIKSDGTEKLISEIELIEFSPNVNSVTINGIIETGDYTQVEFDLGVRQDLNEQDPATFDQNHPLSVLNDMYWTWSTQYIFAKLEGVEISGNDTMSFFMHSGTEDLYRPDVRVSKTFTQIKGGTNVNVHLDMHTLLNQPDYTFNLTVDGLSLIHI